MGIPWQNLIILCNRVIVTGHVSFSEINGDGEILRTPSPRGRDKELYSRDKNHVFGRIGRE
jgi:hypothetical protein